MREKQLEKFTNKRYFETVERLGGKKATYPKLPKKP